MMRPVPLMAIVAVVLIITYGLISSFQYEPDGVELTENQSNISEQQERDLSFDESKSIKPETNPIDSKGLKNSIRGIAKSFENQSRFPSTSMPIQDEESLQKYIPNQSSGASLPYEGPNGEAWSFGLRTDKFRYFQNEPIEIFVQLMGANASIHANLTISILADRKEIHRVMDGPMEGAVFHTQLDTSRINTSKWPSEVQVMAVADLNGETMQIVETIRYEESIAEVKSVGEGEVEGEYLVIPVALDTKKTGYFRVTGVLFGETSDKPLIHLEGKSKLSINNDTVELKAHIHALQVGEDEGPYLLKHLWIEKMPGPPDYAGAYGVSHQEAYKIAAQPFDQYNDEDYSNPKAQRSLEFLNKLSGAAEKSE